MKKYFAGLSLILTLVGCASKSYEVDKTDPNYHDPKFKIVASDQVRPVDPANKTGTTVSGTVGLPSSDAAVAGVIASGILLTTNRDYYKNTALTGKCICGGPKDSTIQLPCTQVKVICTDEKGKELARVEPTNGEFAFQVKKGVAYRLRIESKNFKLKENTKRNYYMGDDVILNLIQK